MSVLNIIPRRDWAPDRRDPAVTSSGSERPAIDPPFGVLMIHYAGNPDASAPGNQFLSLAPLTYMVNMFNWAHGVGEKGDEYNYVIAGAEGICYEWAGSYRRAAHCSNWNDHSIGVQLGLDVDDVPTHAMIDTFRKLRYQLVESGVLQLSHTVGPHGDYYATSCPGPHVEDAWADLLEPWAPPPSPIPTSESDSMEPLYVKGDSDPAVWVLSRSSGRRRYLPNAEAAALTAEDKNWWAKIVTIRQSELEAIPVA